MKTIVREKMGLVNCFGNKSRPNDLIPLDNGELVSINPVLSRNLNILMLIYFSMFLIKQIV